MMVGRIATGSEVRYCSYSQVGLLSQRQVLGSPVPTVGENLSCRG